jgi:hypothetical protein
MSDINWGIDNEEKEVIIKERLIKLSKDGYQIELNYKFALTQNNQEAIEKFKTSMDGVKASLEFHKEELQKLQS